MKDTLEYLTSLDQNTWLGIIIVTWILLKGIKSIVLAARGIDDDE